MPSDIDLRRSDARLPRAGGVFRAEVIPYLLLVLVGLLFWVRSPLHRPLEGDEIFALRRFASLPYEASMEQVQHWQAFDIKAAIRGIGKCFLTPFDVNNHILTTLPASVGTFLFGFKEYAFRVPALVYGLLIPSAAFYLLRKSTRFAFPAFVMAVALIVHPYFYYYGQTARGYSANCLFVLLQIILVERANRIAFHWVAILLVITSALLCMNTVTMAVLWLAPLFAVLAFMPSGNTLSTDGDLGDSSLRHRRPIQKDWLLTATAAGGVCAMFAISHLREFLVAQGKWGIKFHSASEGFAVLGSILEYLFPGLWMLIAVAGVFGLVQKLRARDWLAKTILLSVVLSLLYIAATRTMPFFRTFGHFIVLAMLQFGWTWDAVGSSRPVSRIMRAALALALIAALIWSAITQLSRPLPPAAGDIAKAITESIRAARRDPSETLVLLPYSEGEQLYCYLPADADYYRIDAAKRSMLSLYVPCYKTGSDLSFMVESISGSGGGFARWKLPAGLSSGALISRGDLAAVCATMRLQRGLPAEADEVARGGVIVWSQVEPHFNLNGYMRQQARRLVGDARLYLTINDFLSQKAVFFFIGMKDDLHAVQGVLDDLQKRTQGEIFTLSPNAQ